MTLRISTQWSSAHFYKQPAWSTDKNQSVFGKCYSEFGHGHDYKLEAEFEILNEQTQALLTQILKDLHETLDHHHLNFVIPEFKTKIPTTENLAQFCSDFILNKTKSQNISAELKLVRLFEKPDLWSEIRL